MDTIYSIDTVCLLLKAVSYREVAPYCQSYCVVELIIGLVRSNSAILQSAIVAIAIISYRSLIPCVIYVRDTVLRRPLPT